MAETTTIRIYIETKSRLDGFFEKKGDSYDDILKRLMDDAEKFRAKERNQK